jgi:hypothetical protein
MSLVHKIGALVLAFLSVSGTAIAQAPPAPPQPTFEGTFETLRPEQQQLVSNWCRRLAEATKREIDPIALYDSLPLATRTTFNAVTHALMQTPLTDEQGRSLGASALTIISNIDGVAGRVVGARGDEQFRIYVQLAPDALDRLGRSREFGRSADNTVYHKGYPISFRSRGGAPSIQVSLARSGAVGDIDVDYRSSIFPVSLLNGHLASSNSDIRAGNNDERHNGRWTGMNNWWRDLLRIFPPDEEANASSSPSLTQIQVIGKNARPADAVQAFLATWLVERQPIEVVSFFADDTIACMELESGKPADRGMMRFSILAALQANNTEIGAVSSVSQVTQGVEIPGSRIRKIAQAHEDAFTLYEVREDLAEEMKCGTRLHPEEVSGRALKSQSYGKYVAAVLRMKVGMSAGQIRTLLLAKDGGYWRIVTYTVDPIGDVTQSINILRPATAATAAAAPVNGDPEFLRAATDFYKQWFERRSVDTALTYLTEESLPCISAFLDEGVARPTTAAEQRELIKAGMERTLALAGAARKLDQAIAAPEVNHPDVRVVRHGNARAFGAAMLPDALAAQVDCQVAGTGDLGARLSATTGQAQYGTYYVTGFRMANALEDGGTLVCIWRKEGTAWKIVSFAILTA